MSEFKVGDKVRCIRGEGVPSDGHLYLQRGREYTVSAIDTMDAYVGLAELQETKGEWDGSRFEHVSSQAVELTDTPMTDTEKAIYHLQSLLAVNKATIVITMDEIEILRHNEDETFNPCIEELDELLQALDVIERYED